MHSDKTAMHIEFIAIDNIAHVARIATKAGVIKVSMFYERRFGFRWPMPRHRFGALDIVVARRSLRVTIFQK